MKIAIAQINPVIGDFSHNLSKIKYYADKARKFSCDLVVFSELAVSGYPPRDLLEKDDFIAANIECLNNLVSSISGIGVICGFVDKNPHNEGNKLFNSAVLLKTAKSCTGQTNVSCRPMTYLTKGVILSPAPKL